MTKNVLTKVVLAKSIQTKTLATGFNKNNLYVLLVFLLITISISTTVTIYCYIIKHRLEQEHLLPYYSASNSIKETEFSNKF